MTVLESAAALWAAEHRLPGQCPAIGDLPETVPDRLPDSG